VRDASDGRDPHKALSWSSRPPTSERRDVERRAFSAQQMGLASSGKFRADG